MRLLASFVALALLARAAGPALASPADPARSRASAQAPELAPGVWGAVPVQGTLAGDGSVHLWAPVVGIRTGYTLYDALLHRFLGPSLALHTSPVALGAVSLRPRRMRVAAVVSAGAAVAELPLTLRVRKTMGGTALSTYFSVPLAPYGVVHPLGEDPGRVRIAVDAFFPRP
ncbi:MAG: hypothetical protein VKQ33_10940 [Candidatus Sericytochromatia bacterium]|nr:hypothetical protein [Candidatus Sericytochromatia bacterium]